MREREREGEEGRERESLIYDAHRGVREILQSHIDLLGLIAYRGL